MHVYEILAEPIRRRLVDVLASGEHYSGDLEAIITHEFGVGRTAVQHHLKVLRDNDVVRVHDEWPYRAYELQHSTISLLGFEARRLRELWRSRIGFRTQTDPFRAGVPSKRGYRGHGRDPDLRRRPR